MAVLVLGGYQDQEVAPLADACVTEWRAQVGMTLTGGGLAPLADACVTEWRASASRFDRSISKRHSLMLVLLNGGRLGLSKASSIAFRSARHSLMLVLLNGGPGANCYPAAETLAPLADACVTEWRLVSTG